ncbi:MAG: bifunctional folylpolyglutamate synthase/dihydrofolate synthase [Alphaproteobacteria bacterium]|nr:bifunctional folylpolyglutamate synthase/dihydrofolate synthase [Alphaproteobacteria bacterium]
MRSDPPDLVSALERIKTLHPKVIDLSLGRIERLLADLGSPHLRVPPVVHVAGTNGKGSTIAMMRAVLEASEYRVHVYTSPHLVSFTERIRLCGDLIDATLLAELISHVEHVNGDAPITFFEIITAVAYLAYAQIPADVLLLETGLGGRLDATNVVPHPRATVLTPIAMDHMGYLGDSLAEIAGEKAAIMKTGTPCISAAQPPEAKAVINQTASDAGVDVAWRGEDWTIEDDPFGTVRYQDAQTEWSLPRPALAGSHQIDNLGVALATLARLPFAIPGFGLRGGMRQIEWPARLQKLTEGSLVTRNPLGWELWLDGGHNPSAGSVLAHWLEVEPGPTVAICGMMAGKDIGGYLKPLAPFLSVLATVPIPGHDGYATPDDLAQIGLGVGLKQVVPCPDVEAAIAALQPHLNGSNGRILICGSLYLAGEILKTHG